MHTAFYDYITKEGGNWKAFNPQFKVGDTIGFNDFILKFTRKDPLSIEGNIYGVNAKKDTIHFWSFTEFYSPNKKKSIIIQRSSDGSSYAIGESTIITKDERIGEMEFFYPNGTSEKHKDSHLLFGEDKMRSTSYKYDANNELELLSTLVWERKYDKAYDYKYAVVIPNSKRILFVSDKDGDDEIYSMDIDGNNVIQLTNNEDKDFLPGVSPDGREIIFTSQRDRKEELYKMNIDGSNQVRLTNNDRLNNEADWSPDGKKVAFLSQPKQHTPPCLFIMNPDGTGRTKVTKSEGLVESFPNWSKSGKYISYTQGNDNGRNPDSYVYEVATGKTFAAAEGKFNEFGTHWLGSGDDKLLFSSNRTGNYHIYVAHIKTKKIEQLTSGEFHDSSPKTGFKPNSILFISDRSGPSRIYSMDLKTKKIGLIEANWGNL
ncbi:TolB family protein [Maribacter halichondriae]|uniref:TolB family protein n=1 Tax=Maribacter halichondriae TaxID=2980554 RepID=UPI00235A394A|nr:DUF5050 domain-containing protein [Maribacter sp. Hal144]